MKIKNVDFDLLHTFDCGQCFRWNLQQDGSYIGVIYDKVITAKQCDGEVIVDCDDTALINDYFDLNRDYSLLKNELNKDEILKKAIEYGGGIRILKQEPWETVVSFIISANNNIPRIKKIIESLAQNYGEKIKYNDCCYYTFPSADVLSKLTVDDLAVIKSGFRAKYIIDAAKKVVSGEVNLDAVFEMSACEGRQYLKKINGVGDKVADCTLLFAYQKFCVFPKDVWIKRILNTLYSVEEADFESFVESNFGSICGFAQQYLFYYAREFL